MTWLKYLDRIMLKYQRIATDNKNKQVNGMPTTTIGSVHQITSITDTTTTCLMNSWPRNTIRVEFNSNESICSPCCKTKTKILFCKCCGKKLTKKTISSEKVLHFENQTKQKLINGRQAINCNMYKNSTFKNNSIKIFKKRNQQNLKKSKAMTDIKKCRKRSSSSSKTNESQFVQAEKRLKVASFISSTLIETNKQFNANKIDDVKLVLQKSSFVVDFSSTPIKIAPKTSTPIKRLF